MSAEAELPPRGFVFGRLALVLVGLFVGLAVADKLAGTFDTERDLRRSGALLVDEQLGWVNRPSFVFPNGKTHVNSLGLRGPEIPQDAPADELRVLGLGASRTFGDLTDVDHLIWSHVLERQLRRENVGVRVLNGGVNGYSALQAARRGLRLIPRLQPDMILLFISPSAQMLLDSSGAADWVRLDGQVVPADVIEGVPEFAAPAAASLHRTLLDSNLYARYRAQRQADASRPAELERYILTDRERPAGVAERLERTWAELAELGRAAEEAGIELRAVLVPEANQADDPAWRRWVFSSSSKGGPPFETLREEPTRALKRALSEVGIEVWDLSAEAELIGSELDTYTVDGSHWTPVGHRVIATGLMDRLRADPALLIEMIARRQLTPRS